MNVLLPTEIKNRLPRLYEQQGVDDPIVFATLLHPASGWTWFVTEGQLADGDFIFFGYVIGLESEWGYFTLSELEELDIHGIKVEKIDDFIPKPISELKKERQTDKCKWKSSLTTRL